MYHPAIHNQHTVTFGHTTLFGAGVGDTNTTVGIIAVIAAKSD
jgi:hypothetical protein